MTLSCVAILLGCLALAKGVGLLCAPAVFRRLVEVLPRSRAMAILLLLVALPWCVWELHHMPPFAGNDRLQMGVLVAAPVSFFVLLYFLDELLAPRVLGGLMMLVANPMLKAAMWHDSPLRLVVTVLAYIIIVCGMVLVLSPYRFRQLGAFVFTRPAVLRGGALLSLAFGAVMVYLGLMVY